MTASFVTSRARTEPWPHPDRASRHDVELAHVRLPFSEGWHAALYGHDLTVQPYSYRDEPEDAKQWELGWLTRACRDYAKNDTWPYTKPA